jgi:cytochrome c-type biogenesis protein
MGGITDTVVSGPFVLAGLLALAAGLVSFASPSVVPLVPGYLSNLAGLVGAETADSARDNPVAAGSVSRDDAAGTGGAAVNAASAVAGTAVVGGATAAGTGTARLAPRRAVPWRALGATTLFVAGFSLVFIAESALVLGLYTSLIENQVLLTRISGAVAIVMGVVLALPALQREWRPGLRIPGLRGRTRRTGVGRRGRIWGAPLLGAAFGTGWLACTSPTLAGIIALSTATDWNGNAIRGLALVVLYCAGLGIPFLLLALGLGWAGSALAFLRRNSRAIQLIGAALLVLVGIAMLTGLWGYLLAPLQGTALML